MATARLGKERGTLDIEGVVTTPDMARLFDALASRFQENDEYVVDGNSFTLPASGNLDMMLHAVPAGKEMSVYVLNIECSGFTVGSPFNGAAGSFISIHRDNPQAPGTMIDFSPSSNGLMPIMFSYGSDARLLRTNQSLWVRLNGGPVTQPSVSISWQARLRPVVTP